MYARLLMCFPGQHSSIAEVVRERSSVREMAESKSTLISVQSSEMKLLMRDEVLINVRKFEEQVSCVSIYSMYILKMFIMVFL